MSAASTTSSLVVGSRPVPEDSRHHPGTRGFRRLNLAMAMVGLAAFGILYATQPILPELSDDLGVDAATASLSVSAATGALALLVVPASLAAVRLGRVRMILGGLLVAVLLTALTAWAPTFGLLVGLRALTGAALACVVAVAMGHVAREVHPSGLAAAMGLYVAGNSLGGVSGRLVTSGLVDVVSWRWALAGLTLVALVATVVAWWLTPPSVLAGVQGRPAEGVDGPGAGFAALLRDPVVLAVLVVPFVLTGGFVATFNYLSYRLVAEPFSLPSAVVGLVFLAYLSGSASSATAGALAARLGRAPVLVVAVVAMGAGLLLTTPDELVLVVLGLLLLCTGFFAAHAVASGWAPVVGAAAPAQASALYVCAYYAGSSVFGSAAGTAWHGAGWTGVVLAVGVLVLVGLAATSYVAVVRTRVRRAAREASLSGRACSAGRP